MKRKRLIYKVRWDKVDKCWDLVSHLNHVYDSFKTKRLAVEAAATDAKLAWTHGGNLTQLRVFNKNGRIAFERTYGKDPKRSKG